MDIIELTGESWNEMLFQRLLGQRDRPVGVEETPQRNEQRDDGHPVFHKPPQQ
jgi:hypothetical protein